MEYVVLNNTKIPFQITRKTNKNTYFYFKKQGYIQINLSKYQSKKDVIKYMIDNSNHFSSKFTKSLQVYIVDHSKYLFLGETYEVQFGNLKKIFVDHDKKMIIVNQNDYISDEKYYTKFERSEMLKILHFLKEKHQNNGFVQLEDITLKTRATSSRHGSCNYRKKTININLNLIHYDIKFVEYVFLHEIAHLKVPNHSKAFYDLLEKLCPNYKQIKRELKEIYR